MSPNLYKAQWKVSTGGKRGSGCVIRLDIASKGAVEKNQGWYRCYPHLLLSVILMPVHQNGG